MKKPQHELEQVVGCDEIVAVVGVIFYSDGIKYYLRQKILVLPFENILPGKTQSLRV